jgi:hypothetical protein
VNATSVHPILDFAGLPTPISLYLRANLSPVIVVFGGGAHKRPCADVWPPGQSAPRRFPSRGMRIETTVVARSATTQQAPLTTRGYLSIHPSITPGARVVETRELDSERARPSQQPPSIPSQQIRIARRWRC